MRILNVPLFLVFLVVGIFPVRADDGSDEERCVESISEAYSHLSFEGSHSQPFRVDLCTNPLRTWSVYAAVKVYCAPSEIEPGLRHLNEPCQGELSRTPYTEIAPALTDDYIRGLRVVDYEEVPKAVELGSPVLISKAYYDAAFRTNAAWSMTSRMHLIYGAVSYYFWGTVLLIGIFNNAIINRRTVGYKSPKHLPYILTRFARVHHWIRTHLIIPAGIGSYHQRLFYYCSIPTRMEAVPIVSFYILSFVFMAVSYDLFKGNLYWHDPWDQFWRYLSDRTGTLSYANLCLLWLFGGRNNPFLWATGWKFSTFNLFHRTIARVATIEAIVHSAGYTIIVMKKNTYAMYLPMPWWYMGIAATTCMSLLLLFSSIYLRKNFYELFIIIHITFSVIVIVALFIHTAIFSGQYDVYLWPVVIVWSVDRLARLVRLIHCNIHVYANNKRFTLTKGRLSYSESSDILWLEVTIPFDKLEPRPGQYYYIYQPLKWRGYENHPFTLGSWSVDDDMDSDPSDNTLPLPLPLPVPATAATKTTTKFRGRQLTFWIRPFDGWTRRLRNDCLRSPGFSIDSDTFLIEGPYGCVSSLSNYENIVLIAGGSGIAGVLPYLQDHWRQSSSRTRDVTLIWTTRQRELIEEIGGRQQLQLALQREDFHARLYATSQDREGEQIERENLIPKIEAESSAPSATEHTTLLQDDGSDESEPSSIFDITLGRRPDIKALIEDLVSSRKQEEKTAVLVCGPAAMADDARFAVHSMLKAGYKVEYFEEAFGW